MKKNILFCFFMIFFFNPFLAFSQACDSLVPSFLVDLTSKADSLWTSPAIQRAGSCCGNAPNCVEFKVTISSLAQGVVVNIVSGAVAGTLYVSIDCNPPVPFGDTIFFPSTGPHSLSFCKPGTSVYQYSVRSIPACDSLVPSFVVDLSSKADSLWTSPAVQRAGSCCGNTPPCIEFEVTISTLAVGVIVDMFPTLQPPAITFVTIDCNNPVVLGDTIFFPTTGPHSLSYCKPGNNFYEYTVRSIPGTTTDIFNNELQSPISIYPNPASDLITIESKLIKVKGYHIIDLMGKLIQNGTLEDEGKIDIQNIPLGFYFIECFSENNIYRQKIVKE